MEINKEINKVSPDNKNKKDFSYSLYITYIYINTTYFFVNITCIYKNTGCIYRIYQEEIYFTIINIAEVLIGTINIQSIFNFYM